MNNAVTSRTVLITPAKAKKMLDGSKRSSNRPLSKSYVALLAKEMSEGRFVYNGDTVRISINGNVLDANHRLNAIIESGVSMKCLVVCNLPEDVFQTIDQGRKRTFSDLLTIRGEKNCTTLAAAINCLYAYESDGTLKTTKKMRPDILYRLLDECKGLRRSCSYVVAMKCRLISPGLTVSLHYLFSKIDSEHADLFWLRVCNGEHLSKFQPEYIFREMMFNRKNDKKTDMKRNAIAALAIKAFKTSYRGEEMKKLTFGDDENFPTLTDT